MKPKSHTITPLQEREKAILVGVALRGMSYDQVEDNLEELALLADTAGATVVDRIIQDRYHVNPATFIGKGKVNQIIKRVADTEARVII